MNIGDTIISNGKEYTILKILEKGNPSKDVYVCISDKYGYKECFQGFDLGIKPENKKTREKGRSCKAWSEKEEELIRNMILEGIDRKQISKTVARDLERGENSVYCRVLLIEKQLKSKGVIK